MSAPEEQERGLREALALHAMACEDNPGHADWQDCATTGPCADEGRRLRALLAEHPATPAEGAHVCDTGHFDRTVCPEPCGMMHSYCATCGKRADVCVHEVAVEEREALAAILHNEGLEFPARWRLQPETCETCKLSLRVAHAILTSDWRPALDARNPYRGEADRG